MIPFVQRGNVIVTADPAWGDVQIQDIAAVLSSAREELLRGTSLDVPLVIVIRGTDVPFMHRELNGSNAMVTLASAGRSWSQFAYQFGHEMCHVVAWHTRNGDGYSWVAPTENTWLEESLCEACSYLVLERMAVTWRTNPPYYNWKDYADNLSSYLSDHRNELASLRPADFRGWLEHEKKSLRSNPLQRQKNQIIAEKILPYMETNSAALKSISKIRKIRQVPDMSLTEFFKDWQGHCNADERAFIESIASEFGCLFD